MLKPRTLPLLVICIWCMAPFQPVAAQTVQLKPVANAVYQAKASGVLMKKELLSRNNSIADQPDVTSFVAEPTYAKLDINQLRSVFNTRDAALVLTVPFKNESLITLELVQVNLFSDDFIIETSDSQSPFDYVPGVYYQGIVKDDPSSLVALSVFENEIMGVISSKTEGNINIGKYKAGEFDDYLIYADRDIRVQPVSAGCATPDQDRISDEYLGDKHETGSSRTVNVVDIYLEADYQLYQNKGSVINTSNYLTGIFNNSQVIYTNDGISIELSEIFVWTSDDPYSAASSYAALTDFMDYRTTFNGDLAQLCALDPGGLGGVAATIDGLCNDYRYCYSDIDASYSDYPTYSWTIMVFTHELGHLLGSSHTHWCGWPGGAIDNCGPIAGYGTEGGCDAGPAPEDGGTVMSYCHLTVYGINLANGFGPYPTDAIISDVESAGCLDGGGGGSYCASSGNVSNQEWIDRVKLQSIDRVSSDDGGYYDATALSANIKQGVSKTIRFSAGMIGGITHTEYWKIWVDWNHDFDFEDAGEEEVSLSSSSKNVLSGTISAPATATIGMTRMRVSMKYGSAPTPCEIFGFGEVEDFSINVLAALPSELAAGISEMIVYPNPASADLTLQLTNIIDDELYIEIFDLAGRSIQSIIKNTNNGEVMIQTADLPSGIYILKVITSGGEIFTQEIIRE